MWYVYLLRCADGSKYCGITTDLSRRLREHNAGTASKCTRSRRPVSLLGAMQVTDRSEALKLEYEVKQQPPEKKYSYLMGSD